MSILLNYMCYKHVLYLFAKPNKKAIPKHDIALNFN